MQDAVRIAEQLEALEHVIEHARLSPGAAAEHLQTAEGLRSDLRDRYKRLTARLAPTISPPMVIAPEDTVLERTFTATYIERQRRKKLKEEDT